MSHAVPHLALLGGLCGPLGGVIGDGLDAGKEDSRSFRLLLEPVPDFCCDMESGRLHGKVVHHCKNPTSGYDNAVYGYAKTSLKLEKTEAKRQFDATIIY